MKNFTYWLEQNHPEMLSEIQNKTLKKIGTAAALVTGLVGAGRLYSKVHDIKKDTVQKQTEKQPIRRTFPSVVESEL